MLPEKYYGCFNSSKINKIKNIIFLHFRKQNKHRDLMGNFFNDRQKNFNWMSEFVYHIQSNFSPLNSDGSNTMDGWNWFESPVNFPYTVKPAVTVTFV